MRLRTVLMGVIGITLVVFSLSVLISPTILNKIKKRKLLYGGLVVCFSIGSALSAIVGLQYYQVKYERKELPQTVKIDGREITTAANAQQPLFLPTEYQSIEATHPSVVNVHEGFADYQYWMAVTPYPKGDATKENPHIFASNDLLQWEKPDGIENPVDEVNSIEDEEDGRPKQYNSDTHLLFNEDSKELEVFWRYVDDIADQITIFRSTSGNGVDWSEKEAVYQGQRSKGEDWISPAFVKDETGYQVWYVGTGLKIFHRTSKNGLDWEAPKEVQIAYEKKNMTHWHLDVQKNENKYEMLVVGFEKPPEDEMNYSQRHTMNLYYTSSENNLDWTVLKPIIYPSQKVDAWDGKGLYRSCFIKEKDTYYVFYSGIGFNDTRGVGVSYGKDIEQLKGVNYFNTADFLK